MTPAAPILEVRALAKHFPLRRGLFGGATGKVHALDGVSFSLDRGETLSVVGESGCGKSTLGKTILRLTEPTSGEVWLGGERIDNLSVGRLRPLRRRMQVVFQDPFSSLNPRMRVRDILAEPMVNFGLAKSGARLDERVAALMDQVGLPREAMGRYPHEFSGGQRQRIGIARALAPGADLIICDEAVSALDVSVKAQIVNLLGDLQQALGLALLFISHDLAIVEHLTHRVAVMYLGKIVELCDRRTLFTRAHHPYTKALLSAVPVPDPLARRERIILRGDVPSPINPPSGCRFHTRCPFVFHRCRIEEPLLRPVGGGHVSACHLDAAVAADTEKLLPHHQEGPGAHSLGSTDPSGSLPSALGQTPDLRWLDHARPGPPN
ncbi:MAG: ATP-binding cassette domain-containing protein [Acidisphaera sp.]|nr:ATP-binding cassette domain-containing protein [Acidisphaera sp.]